MTITKALTASRPTRAELLARIPGFVSEVAKGAAERDLSRTLPFEAFELFRELELGTLRVPVALGFIGVKQKLGLNILQPPPEVGFNIKPLLPLFALFVNPLIGESSGYILLPTLQVGGGVGYVLLIAPADVIKALKVVTGRIFAFLGKLDSNIKPLALRLCVNVF